MLNARLGPGQYLGQLSLVQWETDIASLSVVSGYLRLLVA